MSENEVDVRKRDVAMDRGRQKCSPSYCKGCLLVEKALAITNYIAEFVIIKIGFVKRIVNGVNDITFISFMICMNPFSAAKKQYLDDACVHPCIISNNTLLFFLSAPLSLSTYI